MTPERMAELVARWVRFYTRDLPGPIAKRRIDEVDADVHDHIAHERALGPATGGSLSASCPGWFGVSPLTRRGVADTTGQDRTIRGIVLATAFILLLPLLAMLVTDEVAWGPADFAVAGALLGGRPHLSGGSEESGQYRVQSRGRCCARGSAPPRLVATLAVGIIGETGDPADLMYGGVLAVGIFGVVIARFRPHGMARALLAMAVAQALVAVIALIAGKHQAPISSVFEIVGLNGLFVALFIGSAWLFRHAARKQPSG